LILIRRRLNDESHRLRILEDDEENGLHSVCSFLKAVTLKPDGQRLKILEAPTVIRRKIPDWIPHVNNSLNKDWLTHQILQFGCFWMDKR